MPRLDGTGPFGIGPRTGRGRGRCGGFGVCVAGMRPPGRALFAFALTMAGAVIRDAMNPAGLTRSLFRALGGRSASRLNAPDGVSARKMRPAEYEVLPRPAKRVEGGGERS